MNTTFFSLIIKNNFNKSPLFSKIPNTKLHKSFITNSFSPILLSRNRFSAYNSHFKRLSASLILQSSNCDIITGLYSSINLTDYTQSQCVQLTNVIVEKGDIVTNFIELETGAELIIEKCQFNNITASTFIKSSGNSLQFSESCCININAKMFELSSVTSFTHSSCSFVSGLLSSIYSIVSLCDLKISDINLSKATTSSQILYLSNPNTIHMNRLSLPSKTMFTINANKQIVHQIDQINLANSNSQFSISLLGSCNWTITRLNAYSLSIGSLGSEIFLELIDCTFGVEPALSDRILYTNCYVDADKYQTQYINTGLNFGECRVAVKKNLPEPETSTSMIAYIVLSFVGGMALGVVVFFVIYFGIKYSIICIKKNKERSRPEAFMIH